MLETLLQIGKILREEGHFHHHSRVERAPQNEERSPVTYLTIPVKEDFSFDLDGLTEITDEDTKRSKLYYLKFKKSESDSDVKYIFGDICYGTRKSKNEVTELGFYKLKNERGKIGSFYRGEKDAQAFWGSLIEAFRVSFRDNIEQIENMLAEKSRLKSKERQRYIFLHFDFQGKHWYELESEWIAINKKLLLEFLGKQTTKESKEVLVLKKSLHKTLASDDKDVQFPRFTSMNIHKAKLFRREEDILDLFYAVKYSETPIIHDNNVKLIVLPRGDNLKASHIEDFFVKRNLTEVETAEAKLKDAAQMNPNEDMFDQLFAEPLNRAAKEISQFDFIFSKTSGGTAPDIDMIEISGIERSFLSEIGSRACQIRNKVAEEREKQYTKLSKKSALATKYAQFSIRQAFLRILDDKSRGKKKYQNHLFRVLPKIYTSTYFKDDILLPAFIEKTEFNLRQGESDFNLMKYDYEFLIRLLNNSNGGQIMEEMKNSPSYQAGLRLGRMAQPFQPHKKRIASFEKNYVGLLSRRISDRQRLIEFANFLNEKLAIHNVAYQNLKDDSVRFSEIISQMSDKDYEKRYCAFGFFQSYFTKYEEPQESTATDNNQ